MLRRPLEAKRCTTSTGSACSLLNLTIFHPYQRTTSDQLVGDEPPLPDATLHAGARSRLVNADVSRTPNLIWPDPYDASPVVLQIGRAIIEKGTGTYRLAHPRRANRWARVWPARRSSIKLTYSGGDDLVRGRIAEVLQDSEELVGPLASGRLSASAVVTIM